MPLGEINGHYTRQQLAHTGQHLGRALSLSVIGLEKPVHWLTLLPF